MSDGQMPRAPVTPIPAATVVVIRDQSDGIEVLMVQRTRKADFAGGALLFPGGKVDVADHQVIRSGRCALASDIPENLRALRIAGVRELFEEANVLFAREAGAEELIPNGWAETISAKYRKLLLNNEVTLLDIAESENLEIASDRLVPFAHWITPVKGRKRFDTHFLVARAPHGQLALHDGSETLETVWIAPARAIADAEAGTRRIVFPTRMNLKKVGRSATADEAVDMAVRTPVVTVLPEVHEVDGKRHLKIPIEAGYGLSEAVVDYSASDQPPPETPVER